MRNFDRRPIRRHLVSCLAILCAGVLAVSLVRPSQDTVQVRTEAHAVQLVAVTLDPPPPANVVAHQRNTKKEHPTASATVGDANLGFIVFFLALVVPFLVVVLCPLCVAAVTVVGSIGRFLNELAHKLSQVPPIAAAPASVAAAVTKMPAAGSEPRSGARLPRSNHTPAHAKPAGVAVAQRSSGKPGAKNGSAARAHSARPSIQRTGR
jgi:hypothetical protein